MERSQPNKTRNVSPRSPVRTFTRGPRLLARVNFAPRIEPACPFPRLISGGPLGGAYFGGYSSAYRDFTASASVHPDDGRRLPWRLCHLRRRLSCTGRALAGQEPAAAPAHSAILGRGIGGPGQPGPDVSCRSSSAGRRGGSAGSGAESSGENDSEGGAGGSPGRGTDGGPGTGSNPGPGTGSNPGSGAGSNGGSGTGSRSGPGRGSDCGTGTGGSADCGSGSNAGSDSGHLGKDRRRGTEEAGPQARGSAQAAAKLL
jgi:hypothetical protein